jgi:hypothetical protein
MKVKDLVRLLAKQDGDAEVMIQTYLSPDHPNVPKAHLYVGPWSHYDKVALAAGINKANTWTDVPRVYTPVAVPTYKQYSQVE